MGFEVQNIFDVKKARNTNALIRPLVGSKVGFPGGSDGKESTCNVGNLGSISGLGRSPGRVHGNPLQYSCLENPMDRGVWQDIVHGVTKMDTT